MTFTGKCRNQETSHLEDDQFFCFCFCVLFCFVLCFLFRSGLIVMGDLSKWKNTKKGSHCDGWPTQLKKKGKWGLEGALKRMVEGSKACSKGNKGSKTRSKRSESSKALEEEARAQKRSRKKKARAQRRARREARAQRRSKRKRGLKGALEKRKRGLKGALEGKWGLIRSSALSVLWWVFI